MWTAHWWWGFARRAFFRYYKELDLRYKLWFYYWTVTFFMVLDCIVLVMLV